MYSYTNIYKDPAVHMKQIAKVGLNAKQLTQGPPETGDEVFAMVGDNIRWGPMFGEDMHQKEHSEILGVNIPMGRDE